MRWRAGSGTRGGSSGRMGYFRWGGGVVSSSQMGGVEGRVVPVQGSVVQMWEEGASKGVCSESFRKGVVVKGIFLLFVFRLTEFFFSI